MAQKREKTKFTGVYQRVSSERMHEGKPDVCYDIAFKVDGRLIWEKAGWKSEGYDAAMAQIVRGDRLRAIRHSEELPQQKKKVPTFGKVAEKYLQWTTTNKARQGCTDKTYYKKHLQPRFENKRLNEISSFDLERMKVELLKEGLAQGTIRNILTLFGVIVNKATAWKLYDGKNPLNGVKKPVSQNRRERFLSFEEARLILDELQKATPTMHDMALLSLHTGLRLSEVAALRGTHIDIKNKLILVADPKNKQARKAYLTDEAIEMLERRIPAKPEGLLFTRLDGGQIKNSLVFAQVVEKLGLNAGITDRRQQVTFHTLRHTHASWLVLGGESILVVQQALGHRDLKSTMVYSHLSEDSRKAAATRLEQAFNKGKENNVIQLNDK
jgi:integrase